MNDGLISTYKDIITNSKHHGFQLAAFYTSIFDLGKPTNSLIANFTRLDKVYGTDVVFFSILDLLDMEELDHKDIFRLVSYFCKKRTLPESVVVYENLSTRIDKLNELEKEIRGNLGTI